MHKNLTLTAAIATILSKKFEADMTRNSTAGSATGFDLAEIAELAHAAPKIWYGTCQIADGITDENAVALIEACSPDTMLALIALARATPQHPDLAELTRYDFFETDDDDELRVEPTGRWVRFEDVEALARATPQHPAAPAYWNSQRKMIERAIIGLRDGWATRKDADDALATLEAATPQHSVTEQDERGHLRARQAASVMPLIGPLLDAFEGMPGDFADDLREEAPDLCNHIEAIAAAMDADDDADDDGNAQPPASTAATQPEQASDLTSAVDAAMVEMANICPPLRRSDCARLIRAALAIPASTAPTEPVRLSDEHPNLKVPTDPACSAKLDELGDDRGQGLDPYWKFGFRTGWHHGVRSLMASTAASEQQASVSEQARKRIAARFANRPRTPATADFDLPAPNDEIEVLGRPNFACRDIAMALRAGGQEIKNRAEDEQAATIHFLLGMYLQHGDGWADAAGSELRRMVAAVRK